MENTLVFGMQYGDEGKGKVVHTLMKDFNGCVRFNGSCNAGHTIIHEGTTYKLHHLPSGLVRKKSVFLESGMVVNLQKLKKEISAYDPTLINICERIHTIEEKHIALDSEGSSVGSTKNGISYCYADKFLRKGVRIMDRPEIKKDPDFKGVNFYMDKDFNNSEGYLFEAAQGIMLDIDYGAYPFVTSSSVLPSMRYNIRNVLGVAKAYISRVGDSPVNYPRGDEVEELQQLGQEIGTTTGRKRRCYWFDFDQLKFVCKIVPVPEIVITKLDILAKASVIKAWKGDSLVSYKNINEFIDDLKKNFPVKYLSFTPEEGFEKA